MSDSALSTTTAEHFNRATAALKAAERDTKAALDSAVSGLASAYGDAQPLLARVGKQARAYMSDRVDQAREFGSDVRDRSVKAYDSSRDFVREEPVKSLLIAAAVGAAVIALVEVVRSKRSRL